MSKTIQATVKVMLSYDYCHFEVSKTIMCDTEEELNDGFSAKINEIHITNKEIYDARKDCQRLADKAVGQYKTAKTEAIKFTGSFQERQQLEREVREIKINKNEENWTIMDKAKVKALEDYNHQCRYNYMDDGEYEIG